jgi:hypothetical protein
MTMAALASDSFTIDRALIRGASASRNLLSEALAQVPLAPLGLGVDELLLIPRHSSRALLRSGADGRPQQGFGRALGVELAASLAAAAIDPPPGTRAGAYRFTTASSFAIWLLGNWAKGGGAHRAAAAITAVQVGGSAIGWARRQLFDHGRSLPGVFAALAQLGLAASVVAQLDPADLVQMRKALLQSHGLPLPEAMAQVWPVAGSEIAGAYTPATAGNGPPTEVRTTIRSVESTAAAARKAGNDLASLPAAAVELLLALLHLQADPPTPRAALAAAVVSVASAASVVTRVDEDEAESTPPPRPERIPHSSHPSHSPTAPFPPLPPLPPLPPSSPSPAVSAENPNLPSATTPQAAAPATPHYQPRANSIAAPFTGFASDFAGLMFLLNAFLAMGLYPDFTRPAEAGLALAPTRLLDRLALHWFGSPYGGDQLHKALAPDAADPPLPDRWQVEPAWLEAFAGEEEATIATTSRQQTLWHPAGFPLAEGPLSKRVERRKRGQRQDPSARWLRCLALYLDARIQRATDDPELGLSSLAIPGHCRISADRIDIDLALADLPLPLRLAGLDRDPGWLPAEGRAIAFHFG